MDVYGLLITKNDAEAFGDWCRDQLPFYTKVVCLDGSEGVATAVQAYGFADRLIYRHEREFEIPAKTDHGLRRVVHDELVRLFGESLWIMCCHTDEFCYHDPRKIAERAEGEDFDLVSWFSPHFYPHPSDAADLAERLKRPVHERFQHYHWGYGNSELPWIEDRLYKARPGVAWDSTTHGSVRPHGLLRPAPFHPIYRHFKVCSIDPAGFELDGHATRYKGHWENLEHRTGLPFRVEAAEDFFVTTVPKYSNCDRFDGVFQQPWNMGEDYRPAAAAPAAMRSPVALPSRVSLPVLSAPPKGRRPVVAIGPRMPGFGSWEWVGADTAEQLSAEFDVRIFDREIPPCDVAVFVKFKPDAEVLCELRETAAVLYAPIDVYGSRLEIEADAKSLRACDRILIHCERLRQYFTSYSQIEYVDHHVKFAAPLRTQFVSQGPLLWAGVHSNLPPVVAWVNSHRLDDELWLLTNPPDSERVPTPAELGFANHNRVRVEAWDAARQREWTAICRGALDVKGTDFRSRHKPPAKGIDFLASGVPIALQPASSTAEHLARLGFEPAALADFSRWLSRDYWEECAGIGASLRELLAPVRVGRRWRRLIREVLAVRGRLELPRELPNDRNVKHRSQEIAARVLLKKL